MGATFLWVLVAVGAARAALPEPCQGGPASWCRDTATAARCRRELYCRDLWDGLAPRDAAEGDVVEGDMAEEDVAEGDVAEGDVAAPGRRKKCSLCTKILGQMKAMAGEDPDNEAVEAALGKVCQALGKRLGRICKRLVKKFRDQISEALQNGDQPRDVCAAMGFCKA